MPTANLPESLFAEKLRPLPTGETGSAGTVGGRLRITFCVGWPET